MLTFPNCKINIGLYITNRRQDGYHDLETVFYPLKSLHDALEIVPSATETALYMSGRKIAGDTDDNLVMKAYRLLQNRFPQIGKLDIHLLKAIPMGAGLGGGSADGAFMLRLLNDYYALGLADKELAAYALQLGSDCPFFIYNTPQFAEGRGEIMSPVALDLSAYSIQLICPEVHVSTAAAFKMINPAPAPFDLRHLDTLPLTEWRTHIVNDFERPVFETHPALSAIKEQLYAGGAIYASMSGSGSSIYGIFPKTGKAEIQTPVPYTSFFYR